MINRKKNIRQSCQRFEALSEHESLLSKIKNQIQYKSSKPDEEYPGNFSTVPTLPQTMSFVFVLFYYYLLFFFGSVYPYYFPLILRLQIDQHPGSQGLHCGLSLLFYLFFIDKSF